MVKSPPTSLSDSGQTRALVNLSAGRPGLVGQGVHQIMVKRRSWPLSDSGQTRAAIPFIGRPGVCGQSPGQIMVKRRLKCLSNNGQTRRTRKPGDSGGKKKGGRTAVKGGNKRSKRYGPAAGAGTVTHSTPFWVHRRSKPAKPAKPVKTGQNLCE